MRYDAGAAAYDRLTGRWSRLYAHAALDAAGVKAGDCVLDLATGTGDTALLASARLGAFGTVVGVDLSLPMLLVAGAKSSGVRLELVAADAQALPFRARTFDAALCQFGLMFFPDRVAALQGVRRLLRPSAHVALTVWGPSHRAPFPGIVAEALSREMPADRDELLRPFALADPHEVEDLLSKAGFQNIHVSRQVRQARFVSFADFWEPIEAGGGRFGPAYLGLSHAARATVLRDVEERVAEFISSGEIVMDLEAYIAAGTA
jgi:ubiquinone/menaquinone biosynthesis C-methylase UbiE